MLSDGTAGTVVRTVKVLVAEGAEALPAASTATALTVCVPPASGDGAVQVHAPLALATATQATAPSREAVTRAPGSAVPARVGVGPVVLPSAGRRHRRRRGQRRCRR